MKNILIIFLLFICFSTNGQIINLEGKELVSLTKTTTIYKHYRGPGIEGTVAHNIYNYEMTFINNQNQTFVLNCKSSRDVAPILWGNDTAIGLLVYPLGYYYNFELEKVCINDISCENNFYQEFSILQISNCSLVVLNPNRVSTSISDFRNYSIHVEYNGELYLIKRITTNDTENWEYAR